MRATSRRSLGGLLVGLVVALGVAPLASADTNTPAADAAPVVASATTTEAAPALDEVMVVVDDPEALPEIAAALASAGVVPEAVTTLDGGTQLSVELPAGVDPTAIANTLEAVDGVAAADPAELVTIFDAPAPNDEKFAQMWGLAEETAKQGVGVLQAWERTDGSPNVIVAVIDTGYIPHSDLTKNLVPGWDFVDNDAKPIDDQYCGSTTPPTLHGTHVAGTIAALGNNKKGVVGVAPGVKVQPIRVLNSCGSGSSSDIVKAMLWAAGLEVDGAPMNPTPAKILNLSLGGGAACSTQPSYQQAIDRVTELGVIVVAAAGNNSIDAAGFVPASCNHVVTVASMTTNGVKSSFSNFGSVVEIAAPGSSIMSTFRDTISTKGKAGKWPEGYANLSGTSMASPHTAGALALLASVNPALDYDGAVAALAASARDFPSTCTGCGAGLLDAGDLVATSPAAPSIAVPQPATVWHPGQKVTVGWEEVTGANVLAELTTSAGTVKLGSKKPTVEQFTVTLPATLPVGSATLKLTISSSTKPVTTSTLSTTVTIEAPDASIASGSMTGAGLKYSLSWSTVGKTAEKATLVRIDSSGTSTVIKDRVPLQTGKLSFVWPATDVGEYTLKLVPDAGSAIVAPTMQVYAVKPGMTFIWPETVASGTAPSVTWVTTNIQFPVQKVKISMTVDGVALKPSTQTISGYSTYLKLPWPAGLAGRTVVITMSDPTGLFTVNSASKTYVPTT